MIFPISDIVPVVCEYLSLGDIINLLRVDHDTYEIVAPFAAVERNIRRIQCPECIVVYGTYIMKYLRREMIVVTLVSTNPAISIHPHTFVLPYTGLVRVEYHDYEIYWRAVNSNSHKYIVVRNCGEWYQSYIDLDCNGHFIISINDTLIRMTAGVKRGDTIFHTSEFSSRMRSASDKLSHVMSGLR